MVDNYMLSTMYLYLPTHIFFHLWSGFCLCQWNFICKHEMKCTPSLWQSWIPNNAPKMSKMSLNCHQNSQYYILTSISQTNPLSFTQDHFPFEQIVIQCHFQGMLHQQICTINLEKSKILSIKNSNSSFIVYDIHYLL